MSAYEQGGRCSKYEYYGSQLPPAVKFAIHVEWPDYDLDKLIFPNPNSQNQTNLLLIVNGISLCLIVIITCFLVHTIYLYFFK